MLTATYDLANKSYNWPSMYGYQPKVTTAVKSGTSDWDSLVIGYNPEYTVGVWSGFDDNRTLDKQYYSLSKRIYQNTFNLLCLEKRRVFGVDQAIESSKNESRRFPASFKLDLYVGFYPLSNPHYIH